MPDDSGIPLSCFAAPDGGCPLLSGDCVIDAFWLGQSGPDDDTERPNVFASDEACTAGVGSATAHPGVEDPTRSLGRCRELCGPSTEPCPCGSEQLWITDLNPAATPARRPPPDAMGATATGNALHGGTCIWCVETSLCVRWHRSLGHDAEEAWNVCQAPPKEATALERFTQRLARAIGELVDALAQAVKF